MGEDATRTEQSSSTIPAPLNSDSFGSPAVDAQDLFVPSSTPSSPAHTLTHRSSKVPTSPGSPGNQVSAITVVALLDQLVVMIETVQENQRRMEKRQADLEGTVKAVQSDLTRLTKSHASTLGGVNKLLERSRKTSGYVKEVRERLERQSGQVKRLEANHAHLLKRNHFKVLIFQEDNEIPTTLLHKDSTVDLASTSVLDEGATSQRISVYDPNYSQEEVLQTISLSSEEGERGVSPPLEEYVEQAEAHEDEFPDSNDRLEWSRADKFKRSSLKKVDSLKKAFSRSSIEKKINKIVPPERREKIMKSFTPNNPKSPTSKTSSYRVSPITFNVKKMRNEDSEVTKAESVNATIDVPVMGGPDGQLPLAEVHNEDEKVNGMDHNPFTSEIADGEASVTDNTELENGLPSKPTEEKPAEDEPKQEVVVQENHEENKENQENGDDNQAKEEQEEEDKTSPVPASSPSAAVAIEQAS